MPDGEGSSESVLRNWLDRPDGKRRRLIVTGAPGSGKTNWLGETAHRTPDALFVDCRGMSAESVALRIQQETSTGPAPHGDRRGQSRLYEDPRGRHVIFLANAQWAGETFHSTEPQRLAGSLSFALTGAYNADIRLVMEWDAARMGAPWPRDIEISPTGTGTGTGAGTAVGDQSPLLSRLSEDASTALTALSWSEVPETPLPVWELLCRAIGGSRARIEIPAVLTELTDVVRVTDHGTPEERLSFLDPSVAHTLRSERPATADTFRRIATALRSALSEDGRPWPERGPAARYAAKTLPVYAALAGELTDTLEDGFALAHCEPRVLWDALAQAFPDGVPQGSVAADVRLLQGQGIDPGDQGEWVAWLHHAALSANRPALADELAGAGVGMPWRTLWSRWRPGGVFGALPGEAGRIDELGFVVDDDGARLVTGRDTTVDKAADPDYAYVRREWDPATGDPATPGESVPEPLGEAEWCAEDRIPPDMPVVFAQHAETGWEVYGSAPTVPPRCPVAVTQAVSVGRTWWLAGAGGLCAVTGAGDSLSGLPLWHEEPLLPTHSRAALWEMPDIPAAAAPGGSGDAVTRQWLEETFGPGACRALPDSAVPAGVADAAARRFLTEVGVPVVSGFLHLITDPPSSDGLAEVPWPADSSSAPPTGGPFYDLGFWMYSRLLLDGGSGQVLRDGTGGMDSLLAGRSLAQFFSLVRLFDAYRRSPFPCPLDRQDARAGLHAWCQRLDPEAADGPLWRTILEEGYPFEDGTWDLASYDGWFIE
ncbi:SUKH-4 family immunity protein [Streptomyces sp. NPDC054786]